jgi:hypothetical protein
MKLVKQSATSWQYGLDANEANLLTLLLKEFPFTDLDPVNMSKTDQEPEAKEREKLLNESLVAHRNELKQSAESLLVPKKFKAQGNGMVMTVSSEERELLLQILNDIRVGCWNALGRPEKREPEITNLSAKENRNYGLMNVAGFFEHSLIKTEK